MRAVALSALAALAASPVWADATSESAKPSFTSTSLKAPFLEQFTDDWTNRWTPSEATKKTATGDETFSYVGKWEVEESSAYPAIVGDKGLVAKTKAAHHAISAPFSKSFDFKKEPLVVQYEVKYQKGGNCGGGYLKLLEDGFQTSGKDFNDKTPWVVMFGPDLTCPGTKVHFIFRHKNPVSGEFEEKHLKPSPTPSIEKTTNLYTLVVNPDDTYQIFINGDSVSKGSLLESFDPPVNPEKEIDDPNDSKPSDWVDESRIADPEATKPADWDEDAPYEIPDLEAEKPEGWLDDEPETIPDPDADKPEEWDDEEDGDWIPPTVRNPKCDDAPGCGEWKRPYKANPNYKGKWYAPMIDNPAYKGEWKPRKIANPQFFEDKHPVQSLNKIGGVGIELWSMTEDILFDNVYVGHSLNDAKALAAESFDVKRTIEADEKKAETPDVAEDGDIHFTKDPAGFVRQKIAAFIEAVQEDPVDAFKTQPETGVALVAAALTLLGMFGTLFGVIGSSQKSIAKVKEAAKTVAPTTDSKADNSTTTATASGKDDSNLKKRAK